MHHSQTPTSANEPMASNTKRFTNLAARAALAGHELHQVDTGFMLSRWSYSKHVADLDAVESLLVQMEGATV